MCIKKIFLILLTINMVCSCSNTPRKTSLDYDVENLLAKVQSLEIQLDSMKRLIDDMQSKSDDTSESSNEGLVDMLPEESRLVAKLKGFDFTRVDIQKLKDLDTDEKYSKLINSAEACLSIINCGKHRQADLVYVEHSLLRRLLPCHLKLKSTVYDGHKLNNRFLYVKRCSFETVNEFFSYLEERINP